MSTAENTHKLMGFQKDDLLLGVILFITCFMLPFSLGRRYVVLGLLCLL